MKGYMQLDKFYATRFAFFKACLHLHICGTGLLAMNRFAVQVDGTVISTEE